MLMLYELSFFCKLEPLAPLLFSTAKIEGCFCGIDMIVHWILQSY